MRMAKFELSPLWVSVSLPALLVSSESENVCPTNGFLAPSQRFCHGSPHRNHDRRKHQVVGGRNKIFSGLALRLSIAQFDKRSRRRTDHICLAVSGKHFVNTLARAHGKSMHKNTLAAAGAVVFPVEFVSDLGDPFFFLGAVGQHDLSCIFWRLCNRPLFLTLSFTT